MRKYIFIALLLSLFSSNGICQIIDAIKIDSTRLLNLKKTLPNLRDSAKVDLLNSIAIKSLFNAGGSAKARTDTCLFYSSIAHNEAVKLNYKHGKAIAMVQLAGAESGMNQPITDEIGKENKIREALQIAEELNNDEIRGQAYAALAWLPSTRNDFSKYEDYSRKAIYYLLKAKDTLSAAATSNWLVGAYSARGEYEKAFDMAKQAIELSKKSGTDFSMNWHQFLVQYSLTEMASIYTAAGDHENAMNCLHEANQYGIDNNTGWLMIGNIADLFYEMKQYDSALAYWNKWRNGRITWSGTGLGYSAWANRLRGRIYLANKEYDKAIEIFKSCNDTLQKYPRPGIKWPVTDFFLLGQAYNEKKDYKTALKYTKQATDTAQNYNQRPQMMKCYQLLSSLYHQLGDNNNAYDYLLKYNIIKDSIQSKQFLLRIYNSKKEAEDAKKESRIGFLNRDNQIKQQQLKQEATFRNFLIAIFIVLVFAGIYVFRNINQKRKNEKLQQLQKEQQWKLEQLETENKHVELQKRSAELEMQALRAQMNPHFIFNCLSSINRFIFKNDNKLASDYLTRFSRLIRMVLMNSSRKLIALEDELEMLRLYLDLERLRFKDAFDYSITTTNIVDAGAIFIPPLLLQPFCENAVWHGLMHKESKGHLNIIISEVINEEEKVLHCVIEDDGVGREKAAEMKSKSAESEKSMGLKITTERLALLNKENNFNTFYKIHDIFNDEQEVAGTRVQLKIKYKEAVEETV